MIIKCNKNYRNLFDGEKSYDLEDDFITNLENNLADNTVDELFDKQLHYLDCTRYMSNTNLRLMQTIGVPYKIEMSKAIYLIETYCGGNKDYYDRLIERHNLNIQFEFENPPLIYKDKRNNPTKNKTKTKTEKVKKEKQPKKTKEEKKEDKLKFKFASFNVPKIKL